ncbi:MAG: FtsX-like permease family protein [Prolixibacteraceae bacterium]|jgi:putative ABC transport system permease protein|nr:FtsX-like permease family protein [Prolixibacteraceae bacterium]MBT6765130.1 FtsX-like permease family protein [Prolixibacteraceae bacterium]MBT6999598.1 FtsX-like permease family protein [Prolixibacteraceae bacterium]MBT7396889.1 FtsX-like permease family protein [Prolixibacteraceae bacterium]
MKGIYERYRYDVSSGVEAIFANRIKSFLTALGIIFGVAAVISMLAIGNGAEQEILEQIKMVGVNNIIISPTQNAINPDEDVQTSNDETQVSTKKFSPGLTLLDVAAIEKVIPSVSKISPVISFNYSAILDGKSKPVVLEGVNNNYFDLFNISLQKGQIFNQNHIDNGFPVCIIGDNINTVFFNHEEAVGNYIKCGQIWLQVIGVVERRDFTASASDELGISSTDNKIFIPAKTMIMRFKNRSLVRTDEIEQLAANRGSNNAIENVNQLDKIVVQVNETEYLSSTAEVINRMLLRRHNEVYDFEITIPELLLKQQQRTKNIFNIVLGVIAGISLIVGGIGIMNIMLASVMERIREIGVRQAIGASRKDIIVQFLSESTLISVSGGIIGIILGVALSKIIMMMFDIKTVISVFSIVISFGVSVIIGVTFGYLPAKRASDQDPVNSLRS